MDRIDRRLLKIIQSDFPVLPEPYAELAGKIGISEEEILSRLQLLKEKGIIRRIGAVFDSRRLGYKSTLCMMKVPEERLQEVAEIVNSYTGVTHNYLRKHSYNMWFTLIEPSEKDLKRTVQNIIEQTGIEEMLLLPAEKIFKIKVNFLV